MPGHTNTHTHPFYRHRYNMTCDKIIIHKPRRLDSTRNVAPMRRRGIHIGIWKKNGRREIISKTWNLMEL
jgi:hypothetical protein